MKINIHIPGALAAIAAVAVSLSACNKKPETAGDKKKPSDEPAAPAPSAKSVADQIKGYWAPDMDGMLAQMKAEMEKAGEVDAAALAFATQMLTMMADKMVIEIGTGKVTILSPDGPEEESFKIVSSDPASGDFVLSSTDSEGNTQSGTGNIKGDTLKMSMEEEGETMVMNRIDSAEHAKRKAAIENFKAPGLPTPAPPTE
jgi:hypothetical protein